MSENTRQPDNEKIVVREARCFCGCNRFRAVNKFLDTDTKVISTKYECIECGESRLSLYHSRC